MSVYSIQLVILVLLKLSNVGGYYINSVYSGGKGSIYYTSPLYCSSDNTYTKPYPSTSCYHSTTRSTCCMKTYTKSEKGTVQSECVCGSDTGIDSTVTTASTTTIVPTTITTTATPTPTTVPTSTTTKSPTPTTVQAATTTKIPTPTTVRAATTTKVPTPTTVRAAATTQSPTPTTVRAATTTLSTPTSAATTTPPIKSLCSASSFRLMNGESVDDFCKYPGVANITQRDGTIQSCSAVYTLARVNGVVKPTFLTNKACKDGIEKVAKSNILSEIQVGKQAFPVTTPIFNLVEGVKGAAFIDIVERYANWLTDKDTCQRLACPYDKTTMVGLLDFSQCKIVSWGATSAAPTFKHEGLHEAAISLFTSGCSSIPNMAGATDTMCFKTHSGAKLYSQGDSGAPIYCKAPANGEWILVGIAAEQLNWGTSPEVKVIPFPG